MPYIVLSAKCPSHLTKKFVEKALEARKKNLFPEDKSIQENLVPSAAKLTEDGARILTVTLVKEGKLEQAINIINKEMVYYSEIEGFESSIEVWSTSQEALQALGIELP